MTNPNTPTPSNSVVTDAEFLRAIGLGVRTAEAQARLEEIANRLDAMQSASTTGSDELVERAFALEAADELERLAKADQSVADAAPAICAPKRLEQQREIYIASAERWMRLANAVRAIAGVGR